MNPIEKRLTARAEMTAGAGRQHCRIDLHLLIKGAELYGTDGNIVGIEVQGEGHVTEDVLWSKVDGFT